MIRSIRSNRAVVLAQLLCNAIKASAVLSLAFMFSPYSLVAAACSATVGAPACAAQTDPGSASASFLPSPYVANPIDVVTGNKYQHSDDYLGFGSRLQFSRHYNSVDSEERTVLGAGWRHSYDVTLKRSSPSRLLLKQSDGRILEFLVDENSDTTYRARHSADGYVEVAELNRWNLSDGRVLSFKGSYLVEIAYPDNRELKLKYKNNRLESVTDHFERSIRLEYYSGKQTLGSYDETPDGISAGDLQSLELPDGSRISYQYDNLQNLTTVSYPEGTQSLYEYKDPDFTHHLTGANEALESTQKHWKYDQYGRAIQHTNDAAEFVVDIEFAPASAQQTEQRTKVKTSDGWKADYGWQHSNKINLPIVTDYQEQACPTCKPTLKRFTEKSIADWQP
ncbi:MAG: RHS repeat domain-containing protein, partial [Granulosicoccaceae bacterium]